MSLRETILESMARTLFVTAYADACDEGTIDGPKAGPGEDWMDVAPTVHDSDADARELAEKMLAEFLRLNAPHDLDALLTEWNTAVGHDSEIGPGGCQVFGHYLAMQSLGHGVGLNDDTGPNARDWKTGYFCDLNL